ncbi:TonB-dependent receptor plug domain-containing protein [Chitinophaga eiseniae]|uniref:TonB-dependent receptor plug domain-containing protein n=1 Tax=Chitinophaga eiseniae TaxID=634771 RepID=A0A847SPE3_9BACT|nr:TonB-dependent receptor plug domain-containing protein [Chitinophaga eiseniae]NLR77902.1 TonB-dependent receptor plug domain-containing protein [Chitinophaga eiseniae]
MKKIICCIAVYLLAMFVAHAQTNDYATYKEKIYIHTSHVFFQPGDDVFFKLYLVNAQDQRPAKLSKVAIVEVMNPAGNILKKMNYKVTDGYTEGSFTFDKADPGGVYKIRAYTTWMRNENDSTFFEKEITMQQAISPRILMQLDFPKKGYGPGDEVVADYSVRNLADQPISNYKIRYKISLAGKEFVTGKAQTNSAGKARLTFTLPNDLQTADGLLNVTIDYDAYTESISRSIPITLNKIDLQLLPEGGTLVAGISSNIAFRAVNEFGKPVDVRGAVYDNSGNNVAGFESYHAGMGQFPFTPQAGKKYTVKITSPLHISQEYAFPLFTREGVVMNFVRKDGKLYALLKSSGKQQLVLTGQTKAKTFYTQPLRLERGTQTVEIDTTLFPTGIAQFTLSRENGLPLAERLVFLNRDQTLQVNISTNKSRYLPREEVVMTVKTTDDKGIPLPSNLSLAVMDDKRWSFADDKQDHILSWLLLSSELHGKVFEPLFYFRREAPKALPALDLVMLTHGYRYFDYLPEVEGGKSLKYMPTGGYVVSGTIRDNEGHPVKASVFLIQMSNQGKARQMNTGEDGTFFFSDLEGQVGYYLAAKPLHSKQPVTIVIEQSGNDENAIRTRKMLEHGDNPFVAPLKLASPQRPASVAELKKVTKTREWEALNDDKKLDEVIVVGYGVQRKEMNVTIKPVNNAVDALEGRVAGIVVNRQFNTGAAPEIQVRGARGLTGNGQPLFIVDGVPMTALDANLNPNNITSIEVIKDATATAIYGTKGANGVIIINTKNGDWERIKVGLHKRNYYSLRYIGDNVDAYTVARRFYAPHYANTETDERTDFRETIYWNPVVQTDKEGVATLRFYNSDAATTFRAIAEGIAWNGKPGHTETTWSARNALQADAKIPPYLTVGDRARIPLVLKNNSGATKVFDISIAVPEGISTGLFTSQVTLEADSSRQVLIPLEAITSVAGIVKFTVKGAGEKEVLSLPITVAQKGFPVTQTFSGDQSAHHAFSITRPLAGSMHAQLKVFSSVEGQLLDGIESMLQEPHGCFEQTSSATYPNILILKYLRESGKSSPEVEAKAMQYLETGYKRLVSYETADHGFEWFGNTPAHEALTAYGLLEFTDMQAFINVDKDMLARTKDFLLSRRDGAGGFKLSRRGLDRFAAVPDAIANLYIVYALTQAGIGKEIQLEYATAVKKALASGDPYQMALMALAASNMKNNADYDYLMEQLQGLYEKGHFQATTTVVNSRDASLRVETWALYAMALARQQSPKIGMIADVISRILSEKTYYGYGATQATVLALQAIVDYIKIKGTAESAGSLNFEVNGHALAVDSNVVALMKTGDNIFNVRYSNPKGGLPYNLQLSYFTLQPPGNPEAPLRLATSLSDTVAKIGATVRMTISVENRENVLQPMSLAKIGIPAGLSLQPWQLKELTDKKEIAYYEIFDNYLVLYWMGYAPNETKTVQLDLKADVPGNYQAKASNCYLYYTPEHKHWQEGAQITIQP